ncbi:MAG: signal recognition particle subunit SRP19/SEC65 family protein [Candidatus Bathycorpusculaceae bacterium]
MRKTEKIIIWPAYFDSTKTRKDGRRVPKNLAVPSPKILEIKEAVEKIDLEYEVVPDSSYPKTPWQKTGMLLVKKREAKAQIIKKIAKQLIKIRSTATTK